MTVVSPDYREPNKTDQIHKAIYEEILRHRPMLVGQDEVGIFPTGKYGLTLGLHQCVGLGLVGEKGNAIFHINPRNSAVFASCNLDTYKYTLKVDMLRSYFDRAILLIGNIQKALIKGGYERTSDELRNAYLDFLKGNSVTNICVTPYEQATGTNLPTNFGIDANNCYFEIVPSPNKEYPLIYEAKFTNHMTSAS